jgi:hypothetical protein
MTRAADFEIDGALSLILGGAGHEILESVHAERG